MNRLIDYQEDLLETLKDRQVASQYLNTALQEEDPRMFVFALNNVLEAQLDKEHQQTYLIESDPPFTTIKAALCALGLVLEIQRRSKN